ncbi:hypothetical protein CCP1ISM_2710001 [Azospirillaceae bacterium]
MGGSNKTLKGEEIMEITAKQSEASDKTISVVYDFGENLAQASAIFGDDMIYKGFVRQAVIQLQSNLRRWMTAGLSDDEIKAKTAEWKPGMVERATPADTSKKLIEKFAKMGPEEKAGLIAALQQMLQQ